MRPRPKSTLLIKVSKAVCLPSHPLSNRLNKLLEVVDAVHSPSNLKTVLVTMNQQVIGGRLHISAEAGPYEIFINPKGNHPELSLLHEIGHFLEWQCIPKSGAGPRDFNSDALFAEWLDSILVSANIQRLLALRDEQEAGTVLFHELNYLLRPNELWARAYSQYILKRSGFMRLVQQIAAENKATVNGIMCMPYWPREQFVSLENAMDTIFRRQGWIQ